MPQFDPKKVGRKYILINKFLIEKKFIYRNEKDPKKVGQQVYRYRLHLLVYKEKITDTLTDTLLKYTGRVIDFLLEFIGKSTAPL